MEFNSVCNHRSNSQNRTTAKRESDLLITGMITDRIGRQEVLLPISHSHYNLGQTPPVGTMSRAKIWKFPSVLFRVSGCCYGYCVQFCDWWI